MIQLANCLFNKSDCLILYTFSTYFEILFFYSEETSIYLKITKYLSNYFTLINLKIASCLNIIYAIIYN